MTSKTWACLMPSSSATSMPGGGLEVLASDAAENQEVDLVRRTVVLGQTVTGSRGSIVGHPSAVVVFEVAVLSTCRCQIRARWFARCRTILLRPAVLGTNRAMTSALLTRCSGKLASGLRYVEFGNDILSPSEGALRWTGGLTRVARAHWVELRAWAPCSLYKIAPSAAWRIKHRPFVGASRNHRRASAGHRQHWRDGRKLESAL